MSDEKTPAPETPEQEAVPEEKQEVFKYEPMTQEKIKQVAKDAFAKQVFFSTMIPPNQQTNLIGSVFMALVFLSKENIQVLVDNKAVLYEYYDRAGPRSINGYPMFMSFSWMSEEDYKKVLEVVKKLEAAQQAVLGEDEKKDPA